jgi:hypothetical protein
VANGGASEKGHSVNLDPSNVSYRLACRFRDTMSASVRRWDSVPSRRVA